MRARANWIALTHARARAHRRDEVQLLAGIASMDVPPVLIAHGAGAHVVAKYLESHAAVGVVFLSPFPPEPAACAERFIAAAQGDTQGLLASLVGRVHVRARAHTHTHVRTHTRTHTHMRARVYTG